MNKLGPQVVLLYSLHYLCRNLLHIASPAIYSLKLAAYTNSVEICFTLQAQLHKILNYW